MLEDCLNEFKASWTSKVFKDEVRILGKTLGLKI